MLVHSLRTPVVTDRWEIQLTNGDRFFVYDKQLVIVLSTSNYLEVLSFTSYYFNPSSNIKHLEWKQDSILSY
jgi:hypothetical protein